MKATREQLENISAFFRKSDYALMQLEKSKTTLKDIQEDEVVVLMWDLRRRIWPGK